MRKIKDKLSWLKHPLLLFGIGALIGGASLIFNQYFAVSVNIASLLSPTGAQTTIYGLRIKHWTVGLSLIFLGAIINNSTKKYDLPKQISFIIFGIGALLMIDEYEAIWNTITTGVYP